MASVICKSEIFLAFALPFQVSWNGRVLGAKQPGDYSRANTYWIRLDTKVGSLHFKDRCVDELLAFVSNSF